MIKLTVLPIQVEGASQRSLVNVNDAHYDGRFAGPPEPLAGGVDRSAAVTDPPQPGRACVALSDRVRGDQPEGAFGSHQIERSPKEVGDEVAIAVRGRDADV